MIKAVIVDDEQDARDFIESIIHQFFKEIEISGKATSVVEGIKAIVKYKPDLVFLDIEMQDGTGFDLLDAIPERNFDVIFITAYGQYALKAFKYSAVNYLVKPIEVEEFTHVIKKLIKKLPTSKLFDDNYNILKENYNARTPLKLVVPSALGQEYINISDIIRFEADGRYTHIYLTGGNKLTVTKPLAEFTALITDKYFYRTHRSHLINLNMVKIYGKREGGSIIMVDGSEVAIARDKRAEFIKIMAKLFT